MNRVIFMVLAISVVLASGMIGSRPVQDEACVPGELVVFFVDDGQPAMSITSSAASARHPSVDRVLTRHGLTSARPLFGPRSRLRNAYLLRFPPQARVEAIISALEHLPSVRSVTKNWKLHPAFTPDDYYYNNDTNSDGRLDQWVFQRTQLDRAWDVTQGDTSVVVALIDTGFDLDHADLNGVVWVNSGETPGNDTDDDSNGYVDDVYGYDFFDGDNDPGPDGTEEGHHGTVIGSIIAAETNTGSAFGVAGASWLSRIMVLRVGDENGFDFEDVIEAINYAIDNGADIINMSFFTSLDITQLETAVASANTAGLILVAAAGDNDTESARYPGSYSEVIRVAAVDSATAKTDLSNYGTDVFVTAPSSNGGDFPIFTCNFDTSATGGDKPHVFQEFGVATSGAAAEVTGAVALLKARYPSASKAFIVSELARGATPLSDALYAQGKLGAGMANAYRSVTQWGTVASDTTWSTLAFVSGDLTVASAETLRVAPGTTIYIAADDNESAGSYASRVEFTVNGYLDCVGTAANPIVFEGFNTSDTDAWLGIKLTPSSLGGRFEHVVIRNAERGIDHWVPITASHVQIEDCDIGIASKGDLTISQSRIASVTDYGILLQRGDATLSSDTLAGSDQAGLHVARYSSNDTMDVEVTNCVFVDNDVYGIQDGDGLRVLDVTGTTISGSYVGVSLSTSLVQAEIAGDISQNTYGVWLSGTASLIAQATLSSNSTAGAYLTSTGSTNVLSTVEDNPVGIFCSGSGVNPSILACTIDGNTTGIKCDQSATGVVRGNTITNNGTGVVALNSALPMLGDVGQSLSGNNVFNRNTWDVSNLTQGTTIKAEGNCWNDRSGPKIIGTGSVDTDPHGTGCPAGTSVSGRDGEAVDEPALPTRYALAGTHPNPFNPTVTVRYDVPAPGGQVSINIYDVAGRLVSTLVDSERPAGRHAVTWSGQSMRGGPVASGVYFVKMTATGFGETRKIVLLK